MSTKPIAAWTLPVPSTALLEGSPKFELRLRREVGLRFSYETEDDAVQTSTLVFEGVEAFKGTYFRARDRAMLDAYDRVVDSGSTPWLQTIVANLQRNGESWQGLTHFMITFDDGPTYEFIARGFRIDDH